MGKAVGGGVYSVENAAQQADAKPGVQNVKVDLESVEFSGHMNPNAWAQLKQDLKALEQKYRPNLKVNFQPRKSK